MEVDISHSELWRLQVLNTSSSLSISDVDHTWCYWGELRVKVSEGKGKKVFRQYLCAIQNIKSLYFACLTLLHCICTSFLKYIVFRTFFFVFQMNGSHFVSRSPERKDTYDWLFTSYLFFCFHICIPCTIK